MEIRSCWGPREFPNKWFDPSLMNVSHAVTIAIYTPHTSTAESSRGLRITRGRVQGRRRAAATMGAVRPAARARSCQAVRASAAVQTAAGRPAARPAARPAFLVACPPAARQAFPQVACPSCPAASSWAGAASSAAWASCQAACRVEAAAGSPAAGRPGAAALSVARQAVQVALPGRERRDRT